MPDRPRLPRRPCRLALVGALCLGAGAAVAQDLPRLVLDPAATTVSGLSSGAFMAVQMHVAFSDRIAGAGVIAGGPYNCAQGSLLLALNDCMKTDANGPDIAGPLESARANAVAGLIAPLDGLNGDRVYLFSGTRDRRSSNPWSMLRGASTARPGLPRATWSRSPMYRRAMPFLFPADRSPAATPRRPSP